MNRLGLYYNTFGELLPLFKPLRSQFFVKNRAIQPPVEKVGLASRSETPTGIWRPAIQLTISTGSHLRLVRFHVVSGVVERAARLHLAERKKQESLGRIIPQTNEEYGYEDHYPLWVKDFGADSADALRRTAWQIVMAGGYQTTGETARRGTNVLPDTGGGWMNGRGDETVTMLQGYARMVDFFMSFEWWKTEPHDELVKRQLLLGKTWRNLCRLSSTWRQRDRANAVGAMSRRVVESDDGREDRSSRRQCHDILVEFAAGGRKR